MFLFEKENTVNSSILVISSQKKIDTNNPLIVKGLIRKEMNMYNNTEMTKLEKDDIELDLNFVDYIRDMTLNLAEHQNFDVMDINHHYYLIEKEKTLLLFIEHEEKDFFIFEIPYPFWRIHIPEDNMFH